MRIEATQQTQGLIVNTMFLEAPTSGRYLSMDNSSAFESRVENTRFFVPQAPLILEPMMVQTGIIDNSVRFEQLRLLWQTERGATSSITEMANCPSYQNIIAMGPSAIPFILRQMEYEGDEPDMWFWALQVLTGTNPVTDSQRGDFLEMANAWLSWARSRYVW